MTKKKVSNRSGRRGDPVSLAPLTPAQALAAALKVKLSDVKRLEEAERSGTARRKPRRKRAS